MLKGVFWTDLVSQEMENVVIENERIIDSQELILVERKRVLYSAHIKLYFQIDLKCEKQEIYIYGLC